MDKQEFVFRTLGKFLAISATAKTYKDIYQKDITKDYMERLMNDLQKIASEYFHPIYKIEPDKFTSYEDYEGSDFDTNDVGC